VTNRTDPQGKRALFESDPTEVEDELADDPLLDSQSETGKEALFSIGPRIPGTAVIECSHCGVRSRRPAIETVVRIMAISWWLPGKRYSRWFQCPDCQRRSWCRVEWHG
jgi:hypothetical protein